LQVATRWMNRLARTYHRIVHLATPSPLLLATKTYFAYLVKALQYRCLLHLRFK